MSYRSKKSFSSTTAKIFFSSLLPVFSRILMSAAGGTSSNPLTPPTASTTPSMSNLTFLHNFTEQLELNESVVMLKSAASRLAILHPELTLALFSLKEQEKIMILAGNSPSASMSQDIEIIKQKLSSQKISIRCTDITKPIAEAAPGSLSLVAMAPAACGLDQLILYSSTKLNSKECELFEYCLIHLQKRVGEAQYWHELKQANRIDSLTGLNNRRFFDEIMQKESERAERYNHPTSLIMLDLDYFKKVNDNFGHQTGDTVLKNLGKILLDEVRQSDTPCRYGGEEFAIILPETGLAEAQQIAERIRKAVARLAIVTHNNVHLKVTASLGIASTELNHTCDLLERADQALYCAKNRGRNQSVVADPEIDPTSAHPTVLKNHNTAPISSCFQNLSVLGGSC
ncbi:GGDEF domain-containing protein [bacterium]|nr:GGDEF domain-containing protein [bacterium]